MVARRFPGRETQLASSSTFASARQRGLLGLVDDSSRLVNSGKLPERKCSRRCFARVGGHVCFQPLDLLG